MYIKSQGWALENGTRKTRVSNEKTQILSMKIYKTRLYSVKIKDTQFFFTKTR